jgi:hypothetical protein
MPKSRRKELPVPAGIWPISSLREGRAVAAETDQAIIRGGRGLAADLDGVARALGDADIEAGEGVAQARFELFEHLPAPAVSGGRIHDEQRFHRGTFWHL